MKIHIFFCRFPPGVDPVKCPNYPYCGTPAEVIVIPGAAPGVNPGIVPSVVPGVVPGPTAEWRDITDLSRISSISLPDLISRYYYRV